MSQRRVISFLAVISLVGLTALAGVPQLINFQGQLKNNSGSPLVNDTLAVEFKIYDAAVSGNIKWSEIDTVITDANGLFTILLGKKTPVPDSVFNDSLRWLGIKVGSDPEISPRSQLSSVGYSYVSSQWTSAGQDLFRLNGNVGIGTSNPSAKLDVGGTLLVNPTNQFVGVNRSAPVTGAEYFGVYAPTGNGIYGGMYISTGAYDGLPFYGYHTLSNVAWTYLDGQTGNWKLFNNGERITVQKDGNVGIGTTSPLRQLTVYSGNSLFTSRIESSNLDATVAEFSNTSSSSVWEYGVSGFNGTFGGLVSPGNMYIYHQGTSFPALVMGGGSSNNVGIGTGTPTEKLEVAGNLKVTGDIIGSTPWTAFPFAAGHENYGFGTQSVQYRKIGDIVYLRGNLKRSDNGNIGGGELLGTLPVGYRPPAQLLFSTWSNGLTINTNGDIVAGYSGPFAQGFDGVFFSTSP
ncbi:MAG: hypothetical protein A2145_05425 [candidate division Zixibacteria bacterium RBG_16_40_9]|nr:MAG: hypothetical protein A2145_05425 [candidate division Zixibacteria bacterium RBG_16_40_9]